VHGKGSFSVLVIMAHGIVSMHAKGVRFAMPVFFAMHWFLLCRACLFAVRSEECFPCAFSLPCIIVLLHNKAIFAVQRRTA
jgi:hypothetical protein